MSILIKGMEMPENCEDCRFCAGLADTEWGTCAGCLIDDEYREASSKSGCPLVEVPAPHGDLIDRDALEADIFPEWNGLYVPDNAYSEKLICNAPIVIEAERTE